MQENPNCPICDSRRWRAIAERIHLLSDRERLNQYEQARYDVLFKIWLPGQHSVRMRSSLCEDCGFVTNLPRPEAADVDAKYRFLEEQIRDYGERESETVEMARADALWRGLKRFLPEKASILDFGGGDGRLMARFAEHGHCCQLVDYNESPRPFVKKIANTLAELPSDLRVDAVICSHVIEHVVDPVSEMRSLAKCLKPSGVLFVEVPLEIWKRPPLHDEPVTHINFFTRASLYRAMLEADLVIQSCTYVGSLHPTGRTMPAIRALGRPGNHKTQSRLNGRREVMSLLKPNIFHRLYRKWYMSKGRRGMYSEYSNKAPVEP
jgi:SAM-dependent methyltransferase